MIKRTISLIIIGLLLNLSFYSAAKSNSSEKDAELAKKVKASIVKLGTGNESKIKVKLKNGTQIKGYISEITEDDFSVMSADNSVSRIPYPQVKQVKGNNLSIGVKIAIAIGVLALISMLAASADI
jgi:hypothetical protein